MPILKFKSTNLQNLHFFTEHLNFPVAIGTYNEFEEAQVNFLYTSIQSHTSTSLCIWCINHSIQFQILYPIRKLQIFKNPYRYFKFLQLKSLLKKHLK